MAMFEELYCEICGAPLGVDDMEAGSVICDICREEDERIK
jgi:uncharacterized Zn finger protein (UPF0148 family)